MKNFISRALLLAAIAGPIVLFLLLMPQVHIFIAAAVSVAIGWTLNVAWARATQDQSNRSIAVRFGWACPTLLVLVTWIIRHFTA
ncbi:hypothetical protein [Massilia sp. TS11]|uniref:hypothetical protein n=1 Tax=Massilia sp. TS11 TaxID=2908003 RepID=UPI001EDB9EDC|nr:hypothetical protein [Massilia sp. TS11]MCG2584168.1 hypothetical protein [Massilia sp. TS11]